MLVGVAKGLNLTVGRLESLADQARGARQKELTREELLSLIATLKARREAPAISTVQPAPATPTTPPPAATRRVAPDLDDALLELFEAEVARRADRPDLRGWTERSAPQLCPIPWHLGQLIDLFARAIERPNRGVRSARMCGSEAALTASARARPVAPPRATPTSRGASSAR